MEVEAEAVPNPPEPPKAAEKEPKVPVVEAGS